MPAIQKYKPQSGVKSEVLFCLMNNEWLMCHSVPVSTCSGTGGMSSSDNNRLFLWLLHTTDNNTVGTQKYASSTIHSHHLAVL
jgi:hypothetical protein